MFSRTKTQPLNILFVRDYSMFRKLLPTSYSTGLRQDNRLYGTSYKNYKFRAAFKVRIYIFRQNFDICDLLETGRCVNLQKGTKVDIILHDS